MNSMTQVARNVKPGFARPVNITQIVRAMGRAKKPYPGAVVRLTEPGIAASEPAQLPAVGADCPELKDCPGCGSGIAAVGQALCSECAQAAALKSAAMKNDDDLTLAEQAQEVHRRYSVIADGDHLIFRGTVTGDYAKVSLPVPGENMICLLGSRANLPAAAFEAAARRLCTLAGGHHAR